MKAGPKGSIEAEPLFRFGRPYLILALGLTKTGVLARPVVSNHGLAKQVNVPVLLSVRAVTTRQEDALTNDGQGAVVVLFNAVPVDLHPPGWPLLRMWRHIDVLVHCLVFQSHLNDSRHAGTFS